MLIFIFAEDPAQGLALRNEIQVLLESLKIGVCPTAGPEVVVTESASHEEVLSALRGSDVTLDLEVLPAKTGKNPA